MKKSIFSNIRFHLLAAAVLLAAIVLVLFYPTPEAEDTRLYSLEAVVTPPDAPARADPLPSDDPAGDPDNESYGAAGRDVRDREILASELPGEAVADVAAEKDVTRIIVQGTLVVDGVDLADSLEERVVVSDNGDEKVDRR
jgi:hypothetical protein